MSRPLKVLVVHNRYRSEQPSGENNVVDQEAALLAAGGVDVDAFESRSDDIAGMSLLSKAAVSIRVPWNGSARAALAARLRSDRPDIVHIHNTFPLLSPSVVAACTDVGVPAVATLHNYLQVCPTGTLFRTGSMCTECTWSRFPIAAVRHGCYRGSRLATVPVALNLAVNQRRWWSGVTRFLCISDAQRKVLVRAGMPAELLEVKHNVVPDPGRVRSGPGQHVLYLGRLTEEKGLRLLLTAWNGSAAGTSRTTTLKIAGTGPLERELRAWSAGRADVECMGLLSRGQCHDLLARSAVVVVPSTWPEPFGLVAVEAMAAGVPVVAARHGAFVEIVADRVTGVLHEPSDPVSLATAIREVLAHPERNDQMGRAGRLRYERHFGPAAGLQRLVASYRAAIAAANGSSL